VATLVCVEQAPCVYPLVLFPPVRTRFIIYHYVTLAVIIHTIDIYQNVPVMSAFLFWVRRSLQLPTFGSTTGTMCFFFFYTTDSTIVYILEYKCGTKHAYILLLLLLLLLKKRRSDSDIVGPNGVDQLRFNIFNIREMTP